VGGRGDRGRDQHHRENVTVIQRRIHRVNSRMIEKRRASRA
jgi:hypothetical protein